MTMTFLAPGFADPSHDAQRLFRGVLDAFSHPGRIVELRDAPAGPGTLSIAAIGFLLTFADRETPLWLEAGVDKQEVRDFLRFHAGAPIVQAREAATFGVIVAGGGEPFAGFAIGTDTYPDRAATLVIEVPALDGGRSTIWRGPGIDGEVRVAIDGLGDGFWPAWSANHALIPCGVDLVFACGSRLIALPRSIAVEA
ncbi:MAG: phosphonate C-P lyase system protein PhnH [Reyranella sp.]|uniref:phosphonate C-P lyase system protein PhnH n=1 Tax=Reyranella sp. TaxID=1929291 RepID=UPI001205E733|nr:phosphonate C-P lyase system protein PhnH [Reyranella sp.]TAJ92919.1 MAG: phosphonate C-P lyase system protein PhnH [Reyranella sp.]TBR27330.1 MAG: phosphonate C-P lyase system protein PhnH [Reyranella sp.]